MTEFPAMENARLITLGIYTMNNTADFADRMLSLGLARVSEAAAIASAPLIGRGDEKAADQAAVNAMRSSSICWISRALL